MAFGHQAFNHGTWDNTGGGGGGSSSFELVVVATTTNINLTSAPATIDGYSSLISGSSIILVKNQTPDTGSGNPADGLYVWNGAGSPMTRLTGFTLWESFVGLLVGVIYGNTNNSTLWASNAQTGGILETTPLLFINMSGTTLLPANRAQVATNGIDGTAINLTMNGALSSITFGEVFLNPGTYDMPSMSLNHKVINGVDPSITIIQATATSVFPVSDGDYIVINNVGFKGISSNTTPVSINPHSGITIIFNNCTFDSNAYPDYSLQINSVAGNVSFNNCTLNQKILISGNPSSNSIVFNNSYIANMNNTSFSGSLTYITVQNSNFAFDSFSGGTLIAIDSRITNGCTSAAISHPNNYLLFENCTSFIKSAGSYFYNAITVLNDVECKIIDCDFNNNINTFGSGITLVLGNNNNISNINSAYTLKGSDGTLSVNTSSANVSITLPLIANFDPAINNQIYTIMKSDNSGNRIILTTSGTDLFSTGSNTLSITTQNVNTLFQVRIGTPNKWIKTTG